MRLAIALLVCSACGRIGFDEHADAGVGPDAPAGLIRVVVTGESGTPEAGQPIAGALALFEAGDGTTTALQTDAAGTAALEVGGATTVSVARSQSGTPPAWIVSTFARVGGGTTLQLGAATTAATSTFTLGLSALAGADTYGVIGADRCQLETQSSSTSFAVSYAPACDGQTVTLYTRAAMAGTLTGFQAFTATLTPGGTVTGPASWGTPATIMTSYIGLDGAATDVQTSFFAGSGSDAVQLDYGASDTPVSAGTATTVLTTIGIQPTLVASAVFDGPTVLRALIDAYPLAGATFDGARLPAALTTVSADVVTEQLQWTFGPGIAPTTVIASAVTLTQPDTTLIEWRGFAPPTLGSLHYPPVPASFASIIPTATTTWGTAGALALTLPGTTYATFIETGDNGLVLEPVADLAISGFMP